MPFKKGNKSGGRRKEKHFYDALMISLKEATEDDTPKLRKIANKLADKAMGGEPWAIQMVADRVDGKPTQEIDQNITDDRPIAALATAELASRVGDYLARIEAIANGTAKQGEGKDKPADIRKLN